MSPKGRHTKSKSRISAYEKMLNEDLDQREKEVEIFIPPGPRLGGVVIETEALSKAYDEKLLVENTGQTPEQVKQDFVSDKFLNAQEAVDYGIADQVR